MRFYTRQHRHYCGIDLHARTMFVCIVSQAGEVLLRISPKAITCFGEGDRSSERSDERL